MHNMLSAESVDRKPIISDLLSMDSVGRRPIMPNIFSMENPSILLTMDTTESDLVRQASVGRPPDINLPAAVDIGSRSSWLPAAKSLDILDVSLHNRMQDRRSYIFSRGKKLMRRADSIWGAWFFFQHYFKPIQTDDMGVQLVQFMVQHDMENMYMWVFSKRPEYALGKMQLRSYMNGHARFGEPQFPFSAEKGFTRSHRMQRKQYRGLSNPQCVHGIEVVRNPNFLYLSEEAKNRWVELTGRGLNFTLPEEAADYSSWRVLPCIDLEMERSEVCSLTKCSIDSSVKKQQICKSWEDDFGGSTLDLSCKLMGQLGGSSLNGSSLQKRKHRSDGYCGNNEDECCTHHGNTAGEIVGEESHCTPWHSESSGVLLDASGPVTAAKSIYEDEQGYLIMVSLPFTDMARVRVSWLNTATHGVVKIHGVSTACISVVTRGDRTFKLTDINPEHCPEGDFVREISLATRIPEDAELQAFYSEESAGLEIVVPKNLHFSEEKEVRVFLPPKLCKREAQLLRVKY